MVLARRSFARATLIGSLFGQLPPRLVQVGLVKHTIFESNVLFPKFRVFQCFGQPIRCFFNALDNPFAAEAWPWSLHVAT